MEGADIAKKRESRVPRRDQPFVWQMSHTCLRNEPLLIYGRCAGIRRTHLHTTLKPIGYALVANSEIISASHVPPPDPGGSPRSSASGRGSGPERTTNRVHRTLLNEKWIILCEPTTL